MTFIELVRAEFPAARIIYTHETGDPLAAAAADLYSTDVAQSVDEIVAFAIANQVDVMVPARNIALAAAAAPRLADHGVVVAIPTTDMTFLDTMRNKGRTYAICNEYQLASTPRWRLAVGADELVEATREWTANGERCCIKPTVGEGASGFRVIDPKWDPARALYNWPSVTISPADLERIVGGPAKNLPPMLVSDYLPGDETSIDVASNDGDVVSFVVRRKQSAALQTIERQSETEAAVHALSKHWSLHGCWNAQFKLDNDGTARLLEVNARPAAGSLHSATLGLNFPALSIQLACGLHYRCAKPPESGQIHRRRTANIVRL